MQKRTPLTEKQQKVANLITPLVRSILKEEGGGMMQNRFLF